MKAVWHAKAAVVAWVVLLVFLRPAVAQSDAAANAVRTNASAVESSSSGSGSSSSTHVRTLAPPIPLRLDVLPGYCVTAELDTLGAKTAGREGSLIVDSVPRHGVLYAKPASGDASLPPQPLRAGRTLEYGEGTLTYCRGDPAVGEETAMMRFLPMPVSVEHPVLSLQVIFATLPVGYAPLANSTLHVDGWTLLKEQVDTVALISSTLDVSTTFSFGLDARSRRLSRNPRDGDLVRYTRHRNSSSSATRNGDEPVEMEAVEVFALTGSVPAWCEFYLTTEDDRPAEVLQLPTNVAPTAAAEPLFTVPSSARLHVRVVPDALEPRRTLEKIWNATAEAGDAAAGLTPAPIVVLGFRGRRAGGAGYSANGTITVAWAPLPRYEAARVYYMWPSDLRNRSLLRPEAHQIGEGADTASFSTELCITRRPYRGWLATLDGEGEGAAVTYPRCVACDPFNEQCYLEQFFYVPDDAETVSAAPELEARLAQMESRPGPENDAVRGSGMRAIDILHLTLIVRHAAFSAAVQYPIPKLLFGALDRQVRHSPHDCFSNDAGVTIELNATSMEPAVVDVRTLLPAAYRTTRVADFSLDVRPTSALNGAAYRVPLYWDVDDARRGVQWRRENGYLALAYGLRPARFGTMVYWATTASPMLLRYAPLRAAADATPSTSARGAAHCYDRFRVHVELERSLPVCVKLCYTLSSRSAVVDAAPTLPAAQTFHTVVYEHTPNLITVPSCAGAGSSEGPLVLDAVPAYGALYQTPSCDSAGLQGARFLGHCGTEPRDSRAGCVCCLHNCSAYIGAALSQGEELHRRTTKKPARAIASTLFYNPSAGHQAREDTAGNAERVVSLLYHPASLKGAPVTQCVLKLHIRPWVATAVVPVGLPPASAEAGTAGPSPPLRQLWMSARADVETGLLGFYRGPNASSIHSLPIRVFECVRRASPLPPSPGSEAAKDAWLGDVYVPADTPMSPTRRYGMLGYWPAATRGCVVLEVPTAWGGNGTQPPVAAPALAVRAVLLTPSSSEPVAQSTLRMQPYLLHARAKEFLPVIALVLEGEKYRYPKRRTSGADVVQLDKHMFWGRGTSPAVIRFRLDFTAGHLQLWRAARHGCVAAAGSSVCLNEGQIFQTSEERVGPLYSPFQGGANLTYTPLRSFTEAARWLRPVRLLDRFEFALVNDDGELIGRPLRLEIVTSRTYHLAQYVVAAALLAGVVALVLLRWTIRERRRMLSWVRSRCSAAWLRLGRLLQRVHARPETAYEMVARDLDGSRPTPGLPTATAPPGAGRDERP